MNEEIRNNIDDEIDLRELLHIIWDKKLLIGAITSIAAILSVIYSLYLPNVYTSSTLLAPTSQEDSISSSLGGLSGLAGLAGVSLPTGSISNSKIAIKRIESFEFFSKYIYPDIKLENLMAIEKWSSKDNKITYIKSIYDVESDKWASKPSAQKSFKEFQRILNISQDELTGLVYLSIQHKSPIIAKQWVDLIIYNINETMREIDKKDAQNSINFLNESSKTVSIQSIKEVVSKLLESQMQTLMLASSNKEYVFKTINSPIIPEEKSGPGRAIICILGTMLGFILSLLVVLLQHFRKNSNL